MLPYRSYNPAAMPNYQDAFISDVAITACDTPDRPFEKVIEELKQRGMEISTANKDQCFIEGSVESRKVAEIDDLPGVEYVRTVFTYVADYPPGDPRDLDKVGREAE
jgi:hypothetical protein